MHHAIAAVVGLLNVLVLVDGINKALPFFLSGPSIGTLASLLTETVPFAAATLVAAGSRRRSVWLLAVVANALMIVTLVTVVALIRGVVTSAVGHALVDDFALAGLLATANVAYLLARAPARSSSRSAPVPIALERLGEQMEARDDRRGFRPTGA